MVSVAKKTRRVEPAIETAEPVAEYGRTSTDEQVDAGTIQNQRDFLGNWRQLYGIPSAGQYYDDGVSGTVSLGDRPDGARLLADARAGRFKVVVVYRLDRLGRSLRALLEALEELDRYGVTIRSATEPFDTSSAIGRFMFQLLGGLAELERATITERTTGGRDRVAKEGRYTGGPIPLGLDLDDAGYYVVTDRVMPVLEQTEPAYIADLFERIATGTTSLNAERTRLSELGVPHATRYGGKKKIVREKHTPWSINNLASVIHNPMYKGVAVLDSSRGAVERPVPAIVDPAVWERAQAMLTQNRRLSKKNAKHDYLLRGLVRCDHCGGSYTGTGAGRSYRCANMAKIMAAHLTKRCVGADVNAATLEDAVWNEVKRFANDPGAAVADAQATLRRRLADESGRAERIAGLRATLAEKEQERQRIVGLYRRGRITEADADRELDEIAGESAAIRELIESLQVRADMVAAQEAYLSDVGVALMTVAGEIDEIERTDDRAAKRRLIELLAPSMTISTKVREPVGLVRTDGPRKGQVRRRAWYQTTLNLTLALRSDPAQIVIVTNRRTPDENYDDPRGAFLVAVAVPLSS